MLVTGVERRVAIETDPDAAAGRPHGLYGNAFAAADPDAVRRATTPIDPPTVTNLVAIAAIAGGRGRYTRDEIRRTLVTAFTGFRAAVVESARLAGGPARVVVHTGYWGCGAFGGNRVLMALLQVVAARMAGLERLVFHTGAPGGDAPLAEALEPHRGADRRRADGDRGPARGDRSARASAGASATGTEPRVPAGVPADLCGSLRSA